MAYLSSIRGAAWAGPTLIALVAVGVVAGLALHLPVVVAAMLLSALVLALTVSVPATRRARVVTRATQPKITTFTPETLVQREIIVPSGEIRQALIVPVEQAEGYQLVLTVDGYQLLNERNEVVTLPRNAFQSR